MSIQSPLCLHLMDIGHAINSIFRKTVRIFFCTPFVMGGFHGERELIMVVKVEPSSRYKGRGPG